MCFERSNLPNLAGLHHNMANKRSPDEYLPYLQQMNLARRRKQAEEVKKQLPALTREEGFQLYFKGANKLHHRANPGPKDSRPSRRKWQIAGDPFEPPSEPTLLERVERLEPEARLQLARLIQSLGPHCTGT